MSDKRIRYGMVGGGPGAFIGAVHRVAARLEGRYALVAAALPFARRALGQHSHIVAAVSVLTVLVMILIVIFDLESAADANHARIPWIYLAYIAAGLAFYFVRRKKTVVSGQ